MPLIDSFNGIDLNVNNVNLPIPNLGPAIQVADVDNFNGGPQGIAEPGIDVMGPEGPVVEFEVGEPVAFPQDGIGIGPIAVLPQPPQPMAHTGDHVDAVRREPSRIRKLGVGILDLIFLVIRGAHSALNMSLSWLKWSRRND